MGFWGYNPATDFCGWKKKQQLCQIQQQPPKGSGCLGHFQCALQAMEKKENGMSDDTASSSCQTSAVKHFFI